MEKPIKPKDPIKLTTDAKSLSKYIKTYVDLSTRDSIDLNELIDATSKWVAPDNAFNIIFKIELDVRYISYDDSWEPKLFLFADYLLPYTNEEILEINRINHNNSEEYASKHNNSEFTKGNEENAICPNCNGKEIVDKIARVERSRYRYSNRIDTNAVNHCNKCGNQWKKYEYYFIKPDELIANWLDEISDGIKEKFIYGCKPIEILKDVPAESIWKEGKRVGMKCSYSTREHLSLFLLRKHFKTIYK